MWLLRFVPPLLPVLWLAVRTLWRNPPRPPLDHSPDEIDQTPPAVMIISPLAAVHAHAAPAAALLGARQSSCGGGASILSGTATLADTVAEAGVVAASDGTPGGALSDGALSDDGTVTFNAAAEIPTVALNLLDLPAELLSLIIDHLPTGR